MTTVSLLNITQTQEQTKNEQKVEIKWDTVVYDDLCYEVYDGLVLLDDINYNTTKNYYERGKYVIMIPIIINF